MKIHYESSAWGNEGWVIQQQTCRHGHGTLIIYQEDMHAGNFKMPATTTVSPTRLIYEHTNQGKKKKKKWAHATRGVGCSSLFSFLFLSHVSWLRANDVFTGARNDSMILKHCSSSRPAAPLRALHPASTTIAIHAENLPKVPSLAAYR